MGELVPLRAAHGQGGAGLSSRPRYPTPSARGHPSFFSPGAGHRVLGCWLHITSQSAPWVWAPGAQSGNLPISIHAASFPSCLTSPSPEGVPWAHPPNKPLPLKCLSGGLLLRSSLWDRAYAAGSFLGNSAQPGRNTALGKECKVRTEATAPLELFNAWSSCFRGSLPLNHHQWPKPDLGQRSHDHSLGGRRQQGPTCDGHPWFLLKTHLEAFSSWLLTWVRPPGTWGSDDSLHIGLRAPY